jgi:Ca2+-transporting ATPase
VHRLGNRRSLPASRRHRRGAHRSEEAGPKAGAREEDAARERGPAGALRVRVEVPGLFGDAARARRLEARLAGLAGVEEVRASARTGRLLVRLTPAADVGSVRAAVAAESDSMGAEAPSSRRLARRALGAASRAARAVRASLRRAHGDAVPEAEEAEPEDAWHARAPEAVAAALVVDVGRGLDAAEAERRRRTAGPNVLAGLEPRGAFAIVAGQVLTVPTAVLAVAAGGSALLGDALEAAAIVGVAGVNVAIGYLTERRAEELLHAWGELRVGRARARRAGRELMLDAAELVPGDVLVLRAGEAVAADARVVRAAGLTADESTLTGESEPAEKETEPAPEDAPVADRSSMVFAGTEIAAGEGEAVVTATGERTQLGAIRRALLSAGDRAAPLERQLDALGKRLAGLSVIAAAAIVPLGLLHGLGARELARTAVALGVAVIPEGISTAGTTALALASRRLFRRGIVIRRLAAAETLGALRAVCADKTGTLTENRMRVEEIVVPGAGVVSVRWPGDGARMELAVPDGSAPDPRAVRDLARVTALNTDVEIADDGAVRRGSGTERALHAFAVGAGFPVSGARRLVRRVREERRSADHPFMITVHDDPELGRIELIKGAPEQVLELCELPDDGAALRAHNEAMASRGLRVLACAWRRKLVHDGQRFAFLGLVGLRDPPRPGVREAIAALRRAGIRTYMLTGDQERTAKAVAASLGIDEDAVWSRVTPEAKVDVVRHLQDAGQIVAMTGDGVNDGPALKAADVGVAMGQRGTDIARAVADVVLARDDLPALVEAVAEGRRLHDNVRRAIDYLVATNMSEVLVMLAGAFVSASPLSPLQLLWLNMLTDVVPALALAVEPAEAGIMERPPRDPTTPLFGRGDYRRLGRAAAEMAAASLGASCVGAARGGSASSMAFTSLVTAQLLHTGACRAGAGAPTPALRRAVLGGFALQLGALASAPLRAALSVRGTPAADLVVAAAIGAVPSALRRLRAPPRVGRRRAGDVVIERPALAPEKEIVR